MTSIDTYKLSFDLGIVKDIALSRYDTSERKKGRNDNELFNVESPSNTIYSCDKLGLGIQRIQVNGSTNEVILKGSAKVLRDQYYEGINLNTWERVIQGYNDTGLIKLDPVDVLNNAKLLSVDVSANMVMDQEPWQYITAMNMIKVNEKYKVEPWKNQGKNVNGISFRGNQRSFKERLIFYDKEKELNNTKELRQYSDQYKNVLRAEMNFTEFRRIRHYYEKNTLQAVLNSKVNANYLLFEKINSKASMAILRLFQGHYEGMTPLQLIKERGMETIIKEDCHMDWDTVNEFILLIQKSRNPSRMRKSFRETYVRLIDQGQKGGKILEFRSPLMDELSHKLKIAV